MVFRVNHAYSWYCAPGSLDHGDHDHWHVMPGIKCRRLACTVFVIVSFVFFAIVYDMNGFRSAWARVFSHNLCLGSVKNSCE